MKTLLKTLTLAALAAVAPMAAQAESFNVTNTLNSGDVIISWPTNVAGTNGLNVLTGGKIFVGDYSRAGFYFTGYNTTNYNGALTVKLVRAWSDSPAAMTYNTNGTLVASDWESGTPVIALAIPIVGAGPQSWGTNLDSGLLGSANWVGIYSVTNSQTTTNFLSLTNCVMGLNKDVMPVHLK